METYILLKEPIPASQASLLLGRIVQDPLHPLRAYCPEDPHLSNLLNVVETTTLDVQSSIDSSRDIGFKTKVFRLASSVRSWRAPRMVTRSLTQHQQAFDTIYSVHKNELNRLITSWRGIGYMAVSTTALIDGEIATQESDGNSVSVSASIDFPMGLGPALNFGSSSSNVNRAMTKSYTKTVNEEVFAVSYRMVKIQTQWLSRASKLKLGSSKPTFKFAVGKSSPKGGSRNEKTYLEPFTPDRSSPKIIGKDKPDPDPQYVNTLSVSELSKVASNASEEIGGIATTTTHRAQPVLQTLAAAPMGAVQIVEPLDSNQELWNAVLDLKTMENEVIELDDMTESDSIEDMERPRKPAHVVLVTEDKHDELADNIVVFETSPNLVTKRWAKVFKDSLSNSPCRLVWDFILFPTLEALEVLEKIPAPGTDRIRWRCACGQKFYHDVKGISGRDLGDLQMTMFVGPQIEAVTKFASGQQEADITEALRANPTEEATGSSDAAQDQGNDFGAKSPRAPVESAKRRRGAPKQKEYRDDKISRWILLCFPPVRDLGLTGYVHESIDDVENDTELFQAMQRIYRETRGSARFFRLEGVREIKFIQFLLAANDNISNEVEKEWPPRDIENWEFETCPADPNQSILTDSGYLAHNFKNPHASTVVLTELSARTRILKTVGVGIRYVLVMFMSWNARKRSVAQQAALPLFLAPLPEQIPAIRENKVLHATPKRLRTELEWKPNHKVMAWGLKFVEGTGKPAWLIFLGELIAILLVIGVFLAFVLWSVIVSHDFMPWVGPALVLLAALIAFSSPYITDIEFGNMGGSYEKGIFWTVHKDAVHKS
ncbi:hypothetical protein MMC32_002407 [Xylographa parallela]|nr:hypothetical protein [Xylographa parallela]